jgi:hypothetical protein
MECWKKPLESTSIVLSLLHHSITPTDCRIRQRAWKPPLGGSLKPGPRGPDASLLDTHETIGIQNHDAT